MRRKEVSFLIDVLIRTKRISKLCLCVLVVQPAVIGVNQNDFRFNQFNSGLISLAVLTYSFHGSDLKEAMASNGLESTCIECPRARSSFSSSHPEMNSTSSSSRLPCFVSLPLFCNAFPFSPIGHVRYFPFRSLIKHIYRRSIKCTTPGQSPHHASAYKW